MKSVFEHTDVDGLAWGDGVVDRPLPSAVATDEVDHCHQERPAWTIERGVVEGCEDPEEGCAAEAEEVL